MPHMDVADLCDLDRMVEIAIGAENLESHRGEDVGDIRTRNLGITVMKLPKSSKGIHRSTKYCKLGAWRRFMVFANLYRSTDSGAFVSASIGWTRRVGLNQLVKKFPDTNLANLLRCIFGREPSLSSQSLLWIGSRHRVRINEVHRHVIKLVNTILGVGKTSKGHLGSNRRTPRKPPAGPCRPHP
jgi:hypothetical protein